MSFRTSLTARLVALSASYLLTFLPLVSLTVPAYAQAGTSRYVPTPAPPKADPTLEPIASDEPIPPAEFPPIPDRLNLSNAIATSPSPISAPTASVIARPGFPVRPTYHQGYGQVPAGNYLRQGQQPTFHQGYGHTPAGAYSQQGQQPSLNQGYGHVAPGAYLQPQQGTAPTGKGASGDSYNANSHSQTSPHLPELPTPVTVSQSTTQDLSLPDDEFSDYHQKKHHGTYAANMLRGTLFGAAGMATGMGLGALRY